MGNGNAFFVWDSLESVEITVLDAFPGIDALMEASEVRFFV